MAVDGVSSALAIRSSVGIELWASSGLGSPYEHKENLPREETKNSRSISFSPDGRYFAYTNGQEIKVIRTADWQLQCTMPRPKAFYLKFSPRGNYLCVWELFVITKDKPEGGPNMFFYELSTGAEVLAIVQKKQTDWEPSWSSDETLLALVVGGEAHFYDLAQDAKGFAGVSRKLGGSRGGMLSVAPGQCPPYLAVYTPGAKGGPSMCKLYKYPGIEQNQMVACKSFFQADRVELFWNKRGTGLLLLTSTEVDKSGASYYGNQAVHFMSIKSDSCSVPLSKGPVHCVKWSPKATEFVVVYGFMPSKAALYNLKCDVIFDFDKGPRNCAYFNPFGNLVVLAGFGNLPGNVEIWDVSKREKIANIKCPDTTHFEWNPNGEHFITATTAPRLRIGNGFKVYHYSGALIHETIWPQGQELLGVEWQQFPENTFKEPVITKIKQQGIKSSQPEASKKVYTPPHLRCKKEGKNPEEYVPQPRVQSKTATTTTTNAGSAGGNNNSQRNKNGYKSGSSNNNSNNNNSNKDSQQHNGNSNNNENGNGNGHDNNNSKKSLKTHLAKNKNGKPERPNNVENLIDTVVNELEGTNLDSQPNQQKAYTRRRNNFQQQPRGGANSTVQQQQQQENQLSNDNMNCEGMNNAEKEVEKKIRHVARKLSDIKKLKVRRENGEVLELNQMKKISKEAKFLDELKMLKNTQSSLTT